MHQTVVPSGSFEAVASFVGEQQDKLVALLHDERQTAERWRQEVEAKLEAKLAQERQERLEVEAKLEQQRQESQAKLEQQRQESQAKIERLQAEAVESKVREAAARVNEVTGLQVRLEALYNAKLLEEKELSTIEDTIADAIGMDDSDDGDQTAWGRVMQMIKLSEGIVSEKMFARQLKRKFV